MASRPGPLDSFSFFPQLPWELRDAIWRSCLPGPKIVELDRPVCGSPWDTYCGDWIHRAGHFRLPVLAAVCQESRKVVLREYYDPEVDADIPRPHYPSVYEHVRFRLGVDILHFNWDEGELGNYDFWDEDNAILYFCAIMRKVPNLIAITAGHLQQDFDDPFFANDVRVSRIDKYAVRDHWLVQVQRISFNFTDDSHALQSGLFGKLELDPMRYVDPWDSETLRRYYQLWQAQSHTLNKPWTRQIAASAEFFTLLDCDQQPLRDRLTRWKEYIDRRWAWNEYYKAQEAESKSVPSWDALFLPPYPGYDWQEDDEIGDYFRSKYTLNRAHPWIQAVLKKMPFFQPMILFRHRTGLGCLPDE
ncbi:hypothetical protein N7490_007925 [Penicillium lividum]|nr:hypothetical protein N7490_007925 [Penicillium lividum]